MSKVTKAPRSIIYLNFAPYENAGRILDFLVAEFSLVVLFSFNFHKLNDKRSNYIQIYQNGKTTEKIKLFELPTPEALLFITLPLITLLIAFQTFKYILGFKRRFGRFDSYLSVNAFTSWIGTLLRAFKIVGETIFWVWDYYPPGYPDWRIRLARWGYWQFDKLSTKTSSKTIFLNKRLMSLRQKIGVLPKEKSYRVVPIGTNPGKITKGSKKIIGHMGVLKQSQGLDFIFDNLDLLIKKIPDLQVEVIGSGPDEPHFRERAKKYTNIKFYGFVKEEDAVDELMRQWSIGIATYVPDKSNPAYWTDPSKIKAYISQGVPVLTTDIAPFAKEVSKAGAGMIVEYGKSDQLVAAIDTMIKKSAQYKTQAFGLAQRYNYRQLYRELFTD